jgi:hypothetical protein
MRYALLELQFVKNSSLSDNCFGIARNTLQGMNPETHSVPLRFLSHRADGACADGWHLGSMSAVRADSHFSLSTQPPQPECSASAAVAAGTRNSTSTVCRHGLLLRLYRQRVYRRQPELRKAALAAHSTGSGLPPKRAPGQPPLTASLGGAIRRHQWGAPASPAMASSWSDEHASWQRSGSLPNQSRLIPGAPVLCQTWHRAGSSPAHAGMMSPLQGTSLLGREVLALQSTPVTQQLHALLALLRSAWEGRKITRSRFSPSSSSAARNIAELRTPRGTNFIRWLLQLCSCLASSASLVSY